MRKNRIIKMTTMLLAAAMLAGAGTTAQAAAKNIDTRDNISLWVGDSRTVLIYQDLNMKAPGGVSYRSKARVEGKYLMLKYRDCYAGRGTGYSLVEEAIPVVENVVSEPGRQNVVFNSGVNDLYNTELNEFYTRVGGKRVPASPETLAKQYWKLYKKNFIKKYPEDYFYLMSLNPIYKPLHYQGNTATNSMVVRFNKKLKSLIEKSPYENVTYLDTYKNIFKKQGLIHKKSAYRYALKYRRLPIRYMKESSSYQLHYTTEVDEQIYNYVNNFMGNDD